MTNWNNLDATKAYQKLMSERHDISLRNELNPGRISSYDIQMSAGLRYNYAAKPVDDSIIGVLQELANEQQLIEKYQKVLDGEVINTSENRMVLHHLTRGQHGRDVIVNDRNLRDFYIEQQNKVRDFIVKVHNGELRSSSGERFETVVQIGIGGSYLGPQALYLALENWAIKNNTCKMKALFIANVDPDDAYSVINKINLEKTLFILVSKSGGTQETLANEHLIRDVLAKNNLDSAKQIVVVTSETSPLANNPAYVASFYMDDYIGGRYSATSAVGGAILSLAFGPDIFDRILNGATEADGWAKNPDIRVNATLMDALIGVYERNILEYSATAILPYCQAMNRFPAHLQQLDMESNGKRVNRFGEEVSYKTGPLVFGEPGTNGQHSFYQLLHQGTDIIPMQFIGFKDSQSGLGLDVEGSTNQQKLNANLVAQIVAFAAGKEDDDNKNKDFPGGRPSSLIYGRALTPESLGALLAHFENKVMFQGFVWNINSFDQEGVQLGKTLASQVLSGIADNTLKAFSSKLGLKP